MPFKKLAPDKYQGPSGRTFNLNQVKRYYARGGHFAKGGVVKSQDKCMNKRNTLKMC